MTHGYCVNEGTTTEECLCHPGWMGETCSDKIPPVPSSFLRSSPRSESGVEWSGEGLSSYYHHEMSASCKIYNQRLSNGKQSQTYTIDRA